jgi:hypothetical protein
MDYLTGGTKKTYKSLPRPGTVPHVFLQSQ